MTSKVVSSILYPYNSDKTNAQKSEIFTKIEVYSYRGSRDVPLVVKGYSIGAVGQQHATHSHQSTNNVLGTLEQLEFYTVVTS